MTEASHADLARVVREHAGRLAASLVALIGDFSTAEDLVQDAVVIALRRWPVDGVPERPDAWLFTVARRRGLDLLRRQETHRRKLAELRAPDESDPDGRLALVFTCCHPALPRAAQIALTLRVVCGLTTEQIARAFLVPTSTVAQRITRAKRKVADDGIPYRIPDADQLAARLSEVLAVIYLLCNEGYLSTSRQAQSRDLVEDAEWLARLLHQLMPTEPEVAGLLALILLHRAPGDRAALRGGRLRGDVGARRAGRRPRPLPPVPRHPRRAAARSRPPGRGPRRGPPCPRADRQPRRAGPAAPAARLVVARPRRPAGGHGRDHLAAPMGDTAAGDLRLPEDATP